MKRDIVVPAVTNVLVAAVPRQGAQNADDLWDVYVINQREDSMDNVLITSQGQGAVDGRDKSTTVMRHFHQIIRPGEALKVEPIQPALFAIENEYWISFNSGSRMLDRKFIFRPGSISKEGLEKVPGLGKRGVVLRS